MSLKERATQSLVDNYSVIFPLDGRRQPLNIPPCILKEVFHRLVFNGIIYVPLLGEIVDSRLESLDLSSAPGLNNTVAGVLEGFSGLKMLSLNKVTADSIALCKMFHKLTMLTTLKITESPTFDDSVLIMISICCPALQELNAAGSGIMDKGVEALARHSSKLVSLDVSYTEISPTGMNFLMRPECRRIKILANGSGFVIRRNRVV